MSKASSIDREKKNRMFIRRICEQPVNRALAEIVRIKISRGDRFLDFRELPPEVFAALRERKTASPGVAVAYEGGKVAQLQQFLTDKVGGLINLFKWHSHFSTQHIKKGQAI